MLDEVVEENFATVAVCSFPNLIFLIDQLYLLLTLDLYLHSTQLSVHHLKLVFWLLRGVDVRRDSQRAQCNVELAILADDGLKLGLIDALLRPNHSQVVRFMVTSVLVIDRFVLGDRSLHQRMVFLVGRVYVCDERALTRQKAARDLKRLSVPKLALRLDIGWLEGRVRERCFVVFRVGQKSQFRGHAEVGHGEVADLFQNRIATQLQIDLLRRVQVVDGQWRDLHDVADVEQVQPLTLI